MLKPLATKQPHKLNMINDIHFNSEGLKDLLEQYDILGRKINKFIQYLESNWKSIKPAPST